MMFLLDAVFRMQIARDRQRDFENAATRARLLATLGRDRKRCAQSPKNDLPPTLVETRFANTCPAATQSCPGSGPGALREQFLRADG